MKGIGVKGEKLPAAAYVDGTKIQTPVAGTGWERGEFDETWNGSTFQAVLKCVF